jgi:mycothiol synthase
MSQIISLPYQNSQDVPRLIELFEACEAIDQLGHVPSVAELQAELDAPSVNKQVDIRLWEGEHRRLVGFARLSIRSVATTIDVRWWLRIHPDFRRGILGEQMIDWASAGAARLGAARSLPATLLTGIRSDQGDIIAVLESFGFKPARYFVTMVRPLTTPLSTLPAAEGFVIRPLHGAAEAAGWVDLVNDAFHDHWQHHELTLEAFHHELKAPGYRPEFYQLATTASGVFVAFCQCAFGAAVDDTREEKVGWIAYVGTRPLFRRHGLGQTLLLQGLHALQAAGATVASLQVDTANLTGALGLYENAGFIPQETWIVYRKVLTT